MEVLYTTKSDVAVLDNPPYKAPLALISPAKDAEVASNLTTSLPLVRKIIGFEEASSLSKSDSINRVSAPLIYALAASFVNVNLSPSILRLLPTFKSFDVVRLLPVIPTEPVNWWATPPPAVSLSPGVEPEPNLLLPEKFAETPSMKLNPLNEKIFPPKAMSLATCMLDAVISPLKLAVVAVMSLFICMHMSLYQ